MIPHPAPESMFWYWINERHAIYLARQRGEPKPWTKDPILQNYKFVNVFRELDAGTVWLRTHFLEPHRNDPMELLAFNICWYRMFNWIGTGELLGWQTKWNARKVASALWRTPNRVFTNAHLIHSEIGEPKIDSIVDVCSKLWTLRHNIAFDARSSRSLQSTFNLLKTVRHVGGFMAYEMVTDMRHTALLEEATDIMTWANPGPGAMRGLRRLNQSAKPSEGVWRMHDLLERSPQHLEPWVPALEMRDIEHSLCELDKYARVTYGEGTPRMKFDGRGDVHD